MQAIARRPLLLSALAVAAAGPVARADTPPPPIIFVHGNGDTAGLWITTLWRLETNGYPRSRMFALDLRYPTASKVWDKPEPGHSTAHEVMVQLAAEVARVQALTGAEKVVLVAQSRGGNTVRNYLKNGGGAAHVARAVLCGAVNHGVIVSDKVLVGSEFNGASAFMRDLNSTPGEVVPGVAFTTIRSDHDDKYAQPDGRYLGMPGVPTGVGFDGPALAGATNIVVPGIDHRETGYGIAAFPHLFRAVTGQAPARLDIAAEAAPVLNGKVSGFEAGAPTNIGLKDARVTVWRVDPGTAARLGGPVHEHVTGADGIWGPFTADPAACHEFVLEAAGYPSTHIYRGPLPRSSDVLHMRPMPFGKADQGVPAVIAMSRPRGYYGQGRDRVLFDAAPAKGVPPGVPSVSLVRWTGAPGQSVVGTFNDERIASRSWPRAENRVSVIEVTG